MNLESSTNIGNIYVYPVEGCIIVTKILLIRNNLRFIHAVGNFTASKIRVWQGSKLVKQIFRDSYFPG